ncbi:hypothetical protein LL253_04450 [Sphingobium soli]|uniref:Uncharacterized protein n=1 Tax=Sphingobium soli TaxID=1591116 RepID=A0ABS8H080_9SPHN|nr:hypothetical protein [Sphingobium soli]MCC4231939.1 hypothetical protein [Sphingobium soli]
MMFLSVKTEITEGMGARKRKSRAFVAFGVGVRQKARARDKSVRIGNKGRPAAFAYEICLLPLEICS